MRYLLSILILLVSGSLFAQEDCDLFNIQELSDAYLNIQVDTIVRLAEGTFEVQLSNGATFTQVLGCTNPIYADYDPLANVDDGSCTTLPSTCEEVEMDGYIYTVVEVGDQCWFAENLQTTNYANGDFIPDGLTDGEWMSAPDGATTVYGEGNSVCDNFSPSFDACNEVQTLVEYGRLYNWYAVDDERGLCPAGWHVPTDGEWTELEETITAQGYVGTEGTALKTMTGWSDNGNGTNDVGFTALPGGVRSDNNGDFQSAGNVGYWWSSSASGNHAWARNLRHDSPAVDRYVSNRRNGVSVRCLKDAE